MRRIADTYIEQINQKNATAAEIVADAKGFVARFGLAIVLGLFSTAIYILLYKYSGDIRGLAMETATGHKTWFFVPILIALVFSFIHGTFTAHFWDSLGLKAKK